MVGSLADRIEHPLLRELYRYWESLRCGREFPARSDFDPVDIRDMLGSVALADVLYDPLRFRFRLIGTKIAQRWGFDLTGRMVDEVPIPEYRDILLRKYRSIIETRRPQVAAGKIDLADRVREYEELWLPLSGGGTVIDMLVGGFFASDVRQSLETYVSRPAWL